MTLGMLPDLLKTNKEKLLNEHVLVPVENVCMM